MEEVFESPSFGMILNRQDLADLSAMSKDSAVKILRQFQQERIIGINSHLLTIVDPVKLKKISMSG